MGASKTKRQKKYRPSGKTKSQLLNSQLKAFDKSFELTKRRGLEKKELTIRTAALGATLSYSSEWDGTEFYPSNCDKLMDLLLNNAEVVASVLESWHFDWSVLLTVYCDDGEGALYEKYLNLEFEIMPINGGVADEIESIHLDIIKEKCNPNHIISWGYMATITFFD